MTRHLDELSGRAAGSRMRLEGCVLGVRLSLDAQDGLEPLSVSAIRCRGRRYGWLWLEREGIGRGRLGRYWPRPRPRPWFWRTVRTIVTARKCGNQHHRLNSLVRQNVGHLEELNATSAQAGRSDGTRRPKTDIAAGIVVATPMATSVRPTARRRDSGMRSATSSPSPKARAARVPMTNPRSGGLKTRFMSASVVVCTHRAYRAGAVPSGGRRLGAITSGRE